MHLSPISNFPLFFCDTVIFLFGIPHFAVLHYLDRTSYLLITRKCLPPVWCVPCFLDLLSQVYTSYRLSLATTTTMPSPSVRSSRRQSCVAEHNSEASHKRKPKKRQSGRSQEILCLSRLADEGRARANTHVASRSKRARSLSPATRTRSVRARTCQRGVHIQFDH